MPAGAARTARPETGATPLPRNRSSGLLDRRPGRRPWVRRQRLGGYGSSAMGLLACLSAWHSAVGLQPDELLVGEAALRQYPNGVLGEPGRRTERAGGGAGPKDLRGLTGGRRNGPDAAGTLAGRESSLPTNRQNSGRDRPGCGTGNSSRPPSAVRWVPANLVADGLCPGRSHGGGGPPATRVRPRRPSPRSACSMLPASAPHSASTAPAADTDVNDATSGARTPSIGRCTPTTSSWTSLRSRRLRTRPAHAVPRRRLGSRSGRLTAGRRAEVDPPAAGESDDSTSLDGGGPLRARHHDATPSRAEASGRSCRDLSVPERGRPLSSGPRTPGAVAVHRVCPEHGRLCVHGDPRRTSGSREEPHRRASSAGHGRGR